MDTASHTDLLAGVASLSLDKRKTVLPMESSQSSIFTLGRFTLWGRDDINAQCEITRSDIRL